MNRRPTFDEQLEAAFRERLDASPEPSEALFARSLHHHGARSLGTVLGARADRLPAGLIRRLSLEGRG